MAFAPGATINTAAGTTLQLGSTAAPTGLQLNIQGALSKTGGGQVVVDTQTVTYPTTALNLTPVPVTIGAGSVTLGENVTLSAINFQINSTASLNIADDVSAQVRSITGTGLIDLEGTTASRRHYQPLGRRPQLVEPTSSVGSSKAPGSSWPAETARSRPARSP